MRKLLIIGLLLGLLKVGAQADLLGFGAGAGIWSATPAGDALYRGDRFDLKDDAGLESRVNGYLWAYVNHPVPLVPNLRLEWSEARFYGQTQGDVVFDDRTYGGQEETLLSLDQNEILLYWGVPFLPIVSIDLGFGVKQFEGRLSVAEASTDLGFLLPVGYASARVPLVGTAWAFQADLKTMHYSGSHFRDLRLKADWRALSLILKVLIEAGYRHQSFDLDGISRVDAKADVTLSGPFVGVSARF